MRRFIAAVTTFIVALVFAGLASAAGDVGGTYINKDNKKEYITFSPDGKFFLKQQKKPYNSDNPSYDSLEGTYATDGESVTLKLPDGGEAAGKIKGGVFLDNEKRSWTKEGAAEPKGKLSTKPWRKSDF